MFYFQLNPFFLNKEIFEVFEISTVIIRSFRPFVPIASITLSRYFFRLLSLYFITYSEVSCHSRRFMIYFPMDWNFGSPKSNTFPLHSRIVRSGKCPLPLVGGASSPPLESAFGRRAAPPAS